MNYSSRTISASIAASEGFSRRSRDVKRLLKVRESDPSKIAVKNKPSQYSEDKYDAVEEVINVWKSNRIIKPSPASHYNDIVIVKKGNR